MCIILGEVPTFFLIKSIRYNNTKTHVYTIQRRVLICTFGSQWFLITRNTTSWWWYFYAIQLKYLVYIFFFLFVRHKINFTLIGYKVVLVDNYYTITAGFAFGQQSVSSRIYIYNINIMYKIHFIYEKICSFNLIKPLFVR